MHPRPWHRGSLFGDGPRQPLDRNQRARFAYLLQAHRRARRLTRAGLDVAEALVKRLGEDGRLDPSQVTLARDADCSDRTVRTALADMRELGLLRWQRRLVRDSASGWRVQQTSNAYELLATTEAPAVSRQSGDLRCGGNFCRETPNVLIQQSEPAEVRKAQEALAAIRTRMEARLARRALTGLRLDAD
jgi:hypothetical protein